MNAPGEVVDGTLQGGAEGELVSYDMVLAERAAAAIWMGVYVIIGKVTDSWLVTGVIAAGCLCNAAWQCRLALRTRKGTEAEAGGADV